MQKRLNVDDKGRHVGKPRPLSAHETDLLRELVASLRAEGLVPIDVYRAIAERLQRGSLSR